MFMNVIRFINNIPRPLKSMTAEHITNAEATKLKDYISQVKQVYMQFGYKITNILMDGKFACIRGNLA